MTSPLLFCLCVTAVIAVYHVNIAMAVKRRCQDGKADCKDGGCVWMDFICDGKRDCRDGSDEQHCAEWKCPMDEMWRCKNSRKCVWLDFRCDGIQHCSDGSDENNCDQWQCLAKGWTCPKSNKNFCIRKDRRCDGRNDCGDYTDEKNCDDWTCAPNMWKCKDNRCIFMKTVCDGRYNCRDRSDEQNCDQWKCPLGYWQCSNKRCIPIEARCDGYNYGSLDCTDGSDERNCDCGDAQTGASGVIQSPNFPARYSSNTNCSWTINCADCKTVTISFTAFDVEFDPVCGYDYLELLDGTGPSAPSLGKFCGGKTPEPVTSTSNVVTVKFVTDTSVVEKGFRLEYHNTE